MLEELDADADGPLEALDDIDEFDIVVFVGFVFRFLTLSP